ncbi:MAG: putative membrane protein YdjX (TVP38/TMEM64 family) [Patiriisocius sp.]|jgi:uncharacterized membrane protein YdjX (TVP38/TMEM64 family)
MFFLRLSGKKISQLALLALLMAVIVWAWTRIPLNEWIEHFRFWILDLGLLGVVVFIVAYSAFTIILAPVSLLTLSAGLAFGVWGFPLVIASATLAATLAFLFGRYALRDQVLRWINQDRKLLSLSKAVSAEGWRIVGLLRLSPLVPFGMQNYLLSITEIKLVPYVLASAIGMMPGTALYVYIGTLGQAVGRASAIQWWFIGVGLIATGFVAWFVAKRASEVLTADRLEDQQTTP